jgi:hypothetical protein
MYYHNSRKEITPAQRRLLQELGLGTSGIQNSFQANALIQANLARWSSLPATPKQAWVLRNRGLWHDGMTRGQAADLIGRIKDEQGQNP